MVQAVGSASIMGQFRAIACLGFLMLLASCAHDQKENLQEVEVQTTPPLATCRLDRGDVLAGTVLSTPGRISLLPDARALHVSCTKYGYAPVEATSAAQIQPGSPPGYRYDPVISLSLQKAK